MYGKTVDSSTFQTRTGNHSTKGSRRGFVDVDTGVSPADGLSLMQRRDNLIKQQHAFERERKLISKGTSEYKRMGMEIQRVMGEISALNKSRIACLPNTFDRHFTSCARSLLSASEYERICVEARKRMASHEPE